MISHYKPVQITLSWPVCTFPNPHDLSSLGRLNRHVACLKTPDAVKPNLFLCWITYSTYSNDFIYKSMLILKRTNKQLVHIKHYKIMFVLNKHTYKVVPLVP